MRRSGACLTAVVLISGFMLFRGFMPASARATIPTVPLAEVQADIDDQDFARYSASQPRHWRALVLQQ